MSDPHQHTVRVQSLDGGWETLGVDRYRGVVPEGLTCSANRWGPDTCGFSLRRDALVLGPDISTWTPCEIEVAGVNVWDGRIRATPTDDSDGTIVNVQGQGWQYHLDDDLYDRTYVTTRLSDWQDARSFVTTNLAFYTTAFQVTSGDGIVLLALPNGSTCIPFGCASVVLDLGQADAKRVVVVYESGGHASFQLALYGADTPTAGTEAFTLDAAPIATSETTSGVTFTTSRRYVEVRFQDTGSGATGGDTAWVRLKALRVFADAAYEVSAVSVLKLDQIANDALNRATLLLSSDRSEIKVGTFAIPEYAVTDQTARGAITVPNAYENYETKLLSGRRVAVRPRASVPIYEIGEWSGAAFQDASAGSGDDIVNRFIVRGTGPDGLPVRVDRRSSDIGVSTLADRRGFLHTRSTTAGAAITTAVGQRIADLYLSAYSRAPFSGSFRALPGGVRRADSGSEPHPAWLLRDTGQLVRCMHKIDPDTGAVGRAAEIDTVTYNADALASDVALNENRAGLDALLARYQVVVGQRA